MPRMGAFVISGAGGGIGRAIAADLIARGHVVFAFGRDETKLQRTVRELGDSSASSPFGYHAVDLSTDHGCARGIAAARRWIADRPLLGLINNAGVYTRASFLDTDDDAWTSYFTNNLMSAVRLTRGLHADLKVAAATAPTSVLNISSTLALRPIANTVAYSALKAAMNNWTTGLALEWAADRIRVNAICPGIVDTPIHEFNRENLENVRAEANALTPLGRIGTPVDVARAAGFLTSDDSGWTTGAVLTVDGGVSL